MSVSNQLPMRLKVFARKKHYIKNVLSIDSVVRHFSAFVDNNL